MYKCIVCGKEIINGNRRYCSEECRYTPIPINDHVGEVWNELTIESAFRRNSAIYANCLCSCGRHVTVRYDTITCGNTKACGDKIAHPQSEDLTGKTNKYGITGIRLFEVKRDEKHKLNVFIWECRCHCGNIFKAQSRYFLNAKSCGCASVKSREVNIKKAHSAMSEYYVDGSSVIQLYRSKGKLISTNTSGHTGVTYRKDKQKWHAQIVFKSRTYHLGSYVKKEDAIKAREEAESLLHDNFLEWFKEEYPAQWERMEKAKENEEKGR